MERVSLIHGENRIILAVPYGAEEPEVALMAERLAHDLGACAVINRGWVKSNSVNQLMDMANCGDVRHLYQDVVREEFLNPILRFASRISKRQPDNPLMLVLRECKEERDENKCEEMLDIIVGYGAGAPPRYSCSARTKNALVHLLQQEGFGVYEGVAGGRHAAKSKNSLNQLFVRWIPNSDVESVQVEIVKDLITDEELMLMTVEGLVSAIDSLMLVEESGEVPVPKVCRI